MLERGPKREKEPKRTQGGTDMHYRRTIHQQRAVEKVKVIFCTDNRCTGKHTHKVIDEKDMERYGTCQEVREERFLTMIL